MHTYSQGGMVFPHAYLLVLLKKKKAGGYGAFSSCLLFGWGVWGVSPHAYSLAGETPHAKSLFFLTLRGVWGVLSPYILTSRGVWGVNPPCLLDYRDLYFTYVKFPPPSFFEKFSVIKIQPCLNFFLNFFYTCVKFQLPSFFAKFSVPSLNSFLFI